MTQLLPFRIGIESYALELPVIQEVVENRMVYPFPAVPDDISGAIGFHGRIVPVINLPRLMGQPDLNICNRLIVLVNDYGPVALAVDQVRAILNLEISHANRLGHEDGGHYIKEVISWQGQMINLFDLDKLQSRIAELCTWQGGHGG